MFETIKSFFIKKPKSIIAYEQYWRYNVHYIDKSDKVRVEQAIEKLKKCHEHFFNNGISRWNERHIARDVHEVILEFIKLRISLNKK